MKQNLCGSDGATGKRVFMFARKFKMFGTKKTQRENGGEGGGRILAPISVI